MANAQNQAPMVINTAMSSPQNVGADFINFIFVWGAATDTFTIQDGKGNTLFVGIATTGQTTGMSHPMRIPLNNTNQFKVSAITVSGTGGLYVWVN